ncbi:MAG: hypothetical protein KKF12_18710 [Proteobacteria bacterium]|nr:hypothetical protein [Desulfobacula sp.]MBU4132854.1 hypothetical protein [Pseudomonadota bacterium]
MPGQFKLFCEYFHCCGKRVLDLGEVDTEKKAKEWMKKQTLNRKRPRLPKDDLIKTCPVSHCPGKLQIPRYDYRKAPA